MNQHQRVYAATVSKDYRLTLPAAVAAAYAPGFETVVAAAPGGSGAGADHWRLYAPTAWDAVLPAFAASPQGDGVAVVIGRDVFDAVLHDLYRGSQRAASDNHRRVG